MAETVTLRVGLPGCDEDFEIHARVIGRFTRMGREWVRWEPVGELTGALAFYNGWSKGALALPASRVVDA